MSNHYNGFYGTSGPIGETGFSGSSGAIGETGLSDSSGAIGTVSSGLTHQSHLPIFEINEILSYDEIDFMNNAIIKYKYIQ